MAIDFKEILSALRQYRALNAIVAINIAIFLLVPVISLIWRKSTGESLDFASFLALHGSLASLRSLPWSAITYMLTQTNFAHLFFNLLWLYGFGMILSQLRGGRFFFITFLLSGFCGGIAYLAVASGGELLGCSAAALGVMTACGFSFPNLEVNLYGLFKMKMIWIVGIGIIIAMAGSIYNFPSAAAHLGGLAGGSLSALILFPILSKSGSKIISKPRLSIKRKGNISEKFKGKRDFASNSNPLRDQELLDTLLDKIRRSGYQSLSSAERDELARLSSKIRQQ